jgi:hypothetical protein
MAAEVYFADLNARKPQDNKVNKIKKLFERAGFADLIDENDLTAIKIHFGERGNDGFINPIFVRPVVDKIKEAGGKPFATDTNTLYKGERKNSVDHLVTATEHGFVYSVIGAPIIIADGMLSKNISDVEINQKHFKTVKIARDIENADSMIVMSHFKGHNLAGFGGALKNLAMGCAPRVGKMQEHSMRPKVDKEFCTGCQTCFMNCPEDAIQMINRKAQIDVRKCIGCGECMQVCPEDAIGVNWKTEVKGFMERMTEYAYGAIKNKKDKVGFINFVMKVTPDCDCAPWSDAPIVPDIGILASKDPIALDKACYDLVNNQHGFEGSQLKSNFEPGKDKFVGMREDSQGYIQISYGEEMGIGTIDYNLIKI